MPELVRLVLVLAGFYAVLCVLGVLFHRQFMYHPDPERIAPSDVGLTGVEELELTAPDGTALIAWHLPAADGQPTLLYFHGNAGNVSSRAGRFEAFKEVGLGVLMLNYRGFGGSGGRPSERANVADGLFLFDHMSDVLKIPAERIAVYGESIGSGVAVQVAAARPVAAVLLEAPFTSIIAVARRTYGFLPLSLILRDSYRSVDYIERVDAPVLVMHGDQDWVIPLRLGRALYDKAREPKTLWQHPEGGHSDLYSFGAMDAVTGFLAKHRIGP